MPQRVGRAGPACQLERPVLCSHLEVLSGIEEAFVKRSSSSDHSCQQKNQGLLMFAAILQIITATHGSAGSALYGASLT